MKRVFLIIACVVAAASIGQADMADLPGDINDYLPHMGEGQIGVGEDIFTFSSIEEFEVDDNKWKLKGTLTQTNAQGVITLEELEFNPDPLVVGSVLIENITGSAQTYVYHFSQPAVLPTASSMVRGGVTISLLDRDTGFPTDGSYFTDNNTPVYKAFIDGVEVETLIDDPYSLVTAFPITATNYNEEFDWQPYGAGVISNISMQIEFTLSPGDSATVLTRFEVIPEPGTLLLAGFTTLGIVFVRRRFID